MYVENIFTDTIVAKLIVIISYFLMYYIFNTLMFKVTDFD